MESNTSQSTNIEPVLQTLTTPINESSETIGGRRHSMYGRGEMDGISGMGMMTTGGCHEAIPIGMCLIIVLVIIVIVLFVKYRSYCNDYDYYDGCYDGYYCDSNRLFGLKPHSHPIKGYWMNCNRCGRYYASGSHCNCSY
jgi:hypothetical protein